MVGGVEIEEDCVDATPALKSVQGAIWGRKGLETLSDTAACGALKIEGQV